MHFIAKDTSLDLSTPVLMGVLNVTPDSFSDGGKFLKPDAAVARGLEMARQGAMIIDVGGQSTRPGAKNAGPSEEKKRVIPVVAALSQELPKKKYLRHVLISVDTFEPAVADEALAAGADIINDVAGFRNPKMRAVVGKHHAGAIVMHMQGTPQTMQKNPHYGDVVAEVKAFLKKQAVLVRGAGASGVMIDPGIGFGKTLGHNLDLLRRLDEFADLGFPICVGVSRKSFLGKLTGEPSVPAGAGDDAAVARSRSEGTLAAVTACVLYGANVLRVHDVAECKKAMEVAGAMRKQQPSNAADEIRVSAIVVNARVGILPKEMSSAQNLIVNVVAFLDLNRAAKSEDVRDTLDYRRIVAAVEKTAVSRHWPLLEGLADKLAKKIKTMGATRVSVQVVKPESLNNGVPSITVER